MAPLDRKKYAVDVLEHVLEGVRATADEPPELALAEVVRLGVRPWLALGTVTGATTNGTRPESREVNGSGRRRDVDESDRRGEHHGRDAERPSHRERRALKERLERER